MRTPARLRTAPLPAIARAAVFTPARTRLRPPALLATGLLVLFLACAAIAAPPPGWRDAPAFSIPAAQLREAANAVQRERAVDVVVLLDERIYEFDEQHRVRSRTRMIYRVDSPAGVENWAASSASWQPWYQARPEIRARVITPDGREHALDQGLLRDVAARSGDNQVYDDSHVLQGPLPAISVGAVVEEEIETRDEKPFFAAGTVYREYIGRPVPVLHTRVVIDAPESLKIRRAMHLLPLAEVSETRANGRVRWVLEQGPLDEQDAMDENLPPDVAGWASLEFSTAPSWQAVVDQYLAMTEPRIRKDDARPLVASLRANRLASPDARREYIGKVVERLHAEVRYTGVEFGEARLVPAYPAETLRRRFGDCKDKSTLLVAALRAAGIDAHLALLAAGDGQDVNAELPGLGMFNHAIVYVPGEAVGGDAIWIDATTEYARVGTLPPGDTDRLALIIRAGETALVRTPRMRSVDNAQIETRTFHLAEHGPARVVETTETRGTIELNFRGWYAGVDTPERLKSLEEYAKAAYHAKALANYTHTSSTDFSKFYSMTLDIKDAPVGSTDLESAAVGVHVANMISRLPDYFTNQLDGDLDEERKHDVVFEPYVMEWRYRVIAPDGFRARPLPPNATLPLGPARLTASFSRDAAGAIHADWRFDTVKGRYTPAESIAFVKALRELRQRPVTLLAFDHEGVARRADGDFKGSLEAFRTLAGRHPKEPMHRVRHAYALLEAGLGTRAQDEARAATRLAPKNALAWKTLGWVLQHDAVGRRFGAGFDRDGAIAAYRKAVELDPKNADTLADLAVLYEHDARGTRYADRESLALAVETYRERAKHLDDKQDRYVDNLYYALSYLGRYAEARDGLRTEPSSATRRALAIVATAGADGSADAVAAARTLIAGDADRRAALRSAAGILTNLREYALAADLLEAGARGQPTTAAETQRITLLRAVKRGAREALRVTDARSAALRAYALLLAKEPDASAWRALASRHAQAGLARDVKDIDDEFTRFRRAAQGALSRHDAPHDAAADLVFASARTRVDGDDARGYRVQIRVGGVGVNYYVVREDDTYKLLARGTYTGPLAAMALERLDAGDLNAARQWLDWARAEQATDNSDDPLHGFAFSRYWTVGDTQRGQDADAIRLGAALLLADAGQVERALPLLLAAGEKIRGSDEATATAIDLALLRVYRTQKQWPELEVVGTRLRERWPASRRAFDIQQWARIRQGRFDAAEAAARGRLERDRDDVIAHRALALIADARGDRAGLVAALTPVIDGPRAYYGDFNEYAWNALVQHPMPERVVDVALQAYEETDGDNSAVAHTLACVYAATGKPREARDLLLRRLRGSDEPDEAAWFGFGLVAEAYGDVTSARDYYGRIARPENDMAASSLWAMARERLRVIGR